MLFFCEGLRPPNVTIFSFYMKHLYPLRVKTNDVNNSNFCMV